MSAIIPQKQCTKCKQFLPATTEYFHVRRASKDGLSYQCRCCTNEQQKAHYAANPEVRKERVSAWRNANPERKRATNKAWYEANREREIARRKARHDIDRDRTNAINRAWQRANADRVAITGKVWRTANKERVLARVKAWSAANPERKRATFKAWYDANPAAVKAIHQRRRARKRNLPDTFTADEWTRCLDYFNHRCAVCGRPAEAGHTIAADHWIPLVSPDCPGTVAENIIPLCHGSNGCNNRKNAKMPDEWLNYQFGIQDGIEIEQRIKAYFEWLVKFSQTS